MSHEFLHKRYIFSQFPTIVQGGPLAGGPVDFNATGDKFAYAPVVPVDIYRWGYQTIAAQDPDAGGFVLALDFRPTLGSDTDRVEVATITRADAEVAAAGSVVFNEIIKNVAQATLPGIGSYLNVAGTGPLRLEPGQEAVIEVTNAVGAASTGYVWLEVVEHGFLNTLVDDLIEELS